MAAEREYEGLMLVVMLLSHVEGDLKAGLCVPVFRRLATCPPDGTIRLGGRHAWDDQLEQNRSVGAVATRTQRSSTRVPSATAGA
jgi:hypothetical protein